MKDELRALNEKVKCAGPDGLLSDLLANKISIELRQWGCAVV